MPEYRLCASYYTQEFLNTVPQNTAKILVDKIIFGMLPNILHPWNFNTLINLLINILSKALRSPAFKHIFQVY